VCHDTEKGERIRLLCNKCPSTLIHDSCLDNKLNQQQQMAMLKCPVCNANIQVTTEMRRHFDCKHGIFVTLMILYRILLVIIHLMPFVVAIIILDRDLPIGVPGNIMGTMIVRSLLDTLCWTIFSGPYISSNFLKCLNIFRECCYVLNMISNIIFLILFFTNSPVFSTTLSNSSNIWLIMCVFFNPMSIIVVFMTIVGWIILRIGWPIVKSIMKCMRNTYTTEQRVFTIATNSVPL